MNNLEKIEYVVKLMQNMEEVFIEEERPSSYMIARYALKQLIYELQKDKGPL